MKYSYDNVKIQLKSGQLNPIAQKGYYKKRNKICWYMYKVKINLNTIRASLSTWGCWSREFWTMRCWIIYRHSQCRNCHQEFFTCTKCGYAQCRKIVLSKWGECLKIYLIWDKSVWMKYQKSIKNVLPNICIITL